ncbi:hypothetical protein GALL_405410 [mine drainage metagenome]|uniref:Outer membrane protein assembly factor BamB n=1 Tax=mine drainage metagenome TaxID=410659 RepID=A0A1J5QP82_9ZZZZ
MGAERVRVTHDVELVEADGDSPVTTGQADGGTEGPAPVRPAWWRRHVWWLASGLVVVIIAASSVVHAVQVRMRLAELSDVPGIAAPIDGPVHERWSVDSSFQALGEVGGVLVGTEMDENGVTSARGIDATTGVATWSVPVTVPAAWGGSCALADGPVTGRERAVLACHVVDEVPPAPAGSTTLGLAVKAHLATLDPRTGAMLGTFPAGPLDTISAFGTEVAVASHRIGPTGGESTIRRWDPRTGSATWTAHHADPGSGGASSTSVQESSGVLLAQNGGDVWEVSASGAELRSWTGLRTDVGYWLMRTAGGHVLWATYGGTATPSADATGTTTVTVDNTVVISDLGERTAYTLDHLVPWTALVDDGSAPDLVLVAGSDPVAYDLRTGGEIWRLHREVDAFVVLDGTVYAAGAETVSATDARTGATRWAVRTDMPLGPGALETDGRSLFVVGVRAGSSVSTVEALDLAAGTVSWTSTLSHTFDGLTVLGGRLGAVSYTDAGKVTVLG